MVYDVRCEMPPDPVRTSGYCIDDSRRRDIVVDTSHKMQYNVRKKRKISPAVNALGKPASSGAKCTHCERIRATSMYCRGRPAAAPTVRRHFTLPTAAASGENRNKQETSGRCIYSTSNEEDGMVRSVDVPELLFRYLHLAFARSSSSLR